MAYKTLTHPLTKELYELIKQASDKDNRSMASWIRINLKESATKQLKK